MTIFKRSQEFPFMSPLYLLTLLFCNSVLPSPSSTKSDNTILLENSSMSLVRLFVVSFSRDIDHSFSYNIIVPVIFVMQENINLKDGYYKFFNEHKSWKEAESFCNTYGVNVQLASIKVQFY